MKSAVLLIALSVRRLAMTLSVKVIGSFFVRTAKWLTNG
jgi:hypothetical protein